MGLFDLLNEQDRPQGQGGRVFGVVVGVVTDNKDPDGLGRVKVRFAWKDDGDESSWARVATLMAGKGRGSWFLPEAGDEVLVAFDHGNVEHPYVLGALWNGKDTPPGNNSNGQNDLRSITSRCGHQLLFDDSSGKEKVSIKTKGGHTITLDDTAGSEKIEIKEKNGTGKVVIDSSQQSITIESGSQLKFKASMVELQSDGNLTLKAGGVVTIQGSLVKIN